MNLIKKTQILLFLSLTLLTTPSFAKSEFFVSSAVASGKAKEIVNKGPTYAYGRQNHNFFFGRSPQQPIDVVMKPLNEKCFPLETGGQNCCTYIENDLEKGIDKTSCRNVDPAAPVEAVANGNVVEIQRAPKRHFRYTQKPRIQKQTFICGVE